MVFDLVVELLFSFFVDVGVWVVVLLMMKLNDLFFVFYFVDVKVIERDLLLVFLILGYDFCWVF